MKRVFFIILCLFPLLCGARKLRPLVWVLDAGHGGKDQGTSCRNVLEKDLNLQIVKEIQQLLKRYKPGIQVVLTRHDDNFISLEERCRIANSANADLFLSVHVNSAPNTFLSGTETFYADLRSSSNSVQAGIISRNVEKSELLAWLIQKNYGEGGRPNGRGAREKNLFVCQNTNMPAVLTEVGFLSNRDDAAYMNSRRGQKEIATDIYNALLEYYTTTLAKSHHESLLTLRRSGGAKSGIVVDKLKSGDGKVVADAKPISKEVSVASSTSIKSDVSVSDSKVDVEVQEESCTDAAAVAEETVAAPVVPSPSIPVFSIQIAAVSQELKVGDPRLKGLSPVTVIKCGGVYKVLYGNTTDYAQARAALEGVKDRFPDAFIVASVGDVFISTAEALQMHP